LQSDEVGIIDDILWFDFQVILYKSYINLDLFNDIIENWIVFFFQWIFYFTELSIDSEITATTLKKWKKEEGNNCTFNEQAKYTLNLFKIAL
jgi:hypothetical protein